MKHEYDSVIFHSDVTHLNRPHGGKTTFNPTDTTPNVRGVVLAKSGGSVVTITNFLGGTNGESLKILGDGATTIKNGTNIFNNTGADKLLAANKIYTYTYDADARKWYENA